MTAADPPEKARGCALPQPHVVARFIVISSWSCLSASAPSTLLLKGPLRLQPALQVGILPGRPFLQQREYAGMFWIETSPTRLAASAVDRDSHLLEISQYRVFLSKPTNVGGYAGPRTTTSDLLQRFRSLPLSRFSSLTSASTADYPADQTLSLLVNNRRSLLQSQLQGEIGAPA